MDKIQDHEKEERAREELCDNSDIGIFNRILFIKREQHQYNQTY